MTHLNWSTQVVRRLNKSHPLFLQQKESDREGGKDWEERLFTVVTSES